MKFDLHCHTYFSDGTQSPDWVMRRAVDRGVTHLAITDHDCLTTPEASDIDGLCLIPGVEISCQWDAREIHVVGLFVDASDAALSSLLSEQQQARLERAKLVNDKLVKANHGGLLDYLDALPAVSVTRSHMANFLVMQGVVKNRQKAFKQFLAKGAQAYVPPSWCSLNAAVSAIGNAGGIAVLAHPGRYSINKRQLGRLVAHFAESGGSALEVRYPNIDANMMKQLELLAEENHLLLSGGSDFHDPDARWTDLGKFPPLRGELANRGVQEHPRWRAFMA